MNPSFYVRQPKQVKIPRHLISALLCADVSLSAGRVAAAVSTADEICAPTADPCVVSSPVDVLDGSVLDFGLRELQIVGNGSLSIGDGAIVVRCGRFLTTVAGQIAIDARAQAAGGGTLGGDFFLDVFGSCAGDVSRRCQRTLDCQLGTCSSGRCTSDTAVLCSVDADCDLGACQGTTATIDLDGRIRASADVPGSVTLSSPGDITITGQILGNSSSADDDGGTIGIDSQQGAVTVAAKLDVSSGRFGLGGDVNVTAATTIRVDDDIIAEGGESDGGAIDLTAGRDVIVTALVSASATTADGFGGTIDISGDRDVIIQGTGQLRSSGHASIDNFAGDGGDISLLAVRQIVVASGGQIISNGAPPDGSGGFVDLDATGDIAVAGSIIGRARGAQGLGGSITIDGCGVSLESGAKVWNAGSTGDNSLVGHDFVTTRAGSSMTADSADGSNSVSYRRADKPPTLAGTITPAADVFLDLTLAPCATCGNGRLEAGETCDDGGTVAGDGCSADCQLESCVSQTPGYPAVPLCDDGKNCTDDACNTASGNCEHAVACDDGIACTADSCDAGGSCSNAPNDGACSDGNVCTDDSCSPISGCVSTPNTVPCDDGLSCTASDVCGGGTCAGTSSCAPGFVCDPVQDRCLNPGTTTTTTLAPAGCGNGIVEAAEECDDGNPAWQPGQFCNGNCSIVACGDPDDSGSTTASDALFVLRVAVGAGSCDACLCNVDSNVSGPPVTASDALRLLRAAVGQPIALTCPACT